MFSAFSPHAWGWTAVRRGKLHNRWVFPTRVGVDLRFTVTPPAVVSFPHTRGGGPLDEKEAAIQRIVFPTRVGVDLGQLKDIELPWSFPHTRGGGPISTTILT